MVQKLLSTRLVSPVVLVICLVLLSGCGSVSDVSGTVKKDGQPLPDADLVFAPEGKEGERVFYALSVEGGKFQVDYGEEKGMPPGKYNITVTWYTLPNGEPLPPGEAGANLKTTDKVRKLTKEFSRDVSSGDNKLELDVSKS